MKYNELLKQHILYSDGKKLSGVPTNLKLLDNLTNGFQKSDLIILCTPMSEYKNLILKMNKFLLTKTIS